MESSFSFQVIDVPTPTSQRVREALARGRGIVVHGPPGTGKTHAVRAVANGAAWTVVSGEPFAIPRIIADLAAQLGGDDAPTRAYDEGGCSAACEELDALLGDRVLVVDAAERLWIPTEDPTSPDASSLWAPEFGELAAWIGRRVAQRPTVVISRRRLSTTGTNLWHEGTDSWPVKLTWSGDGYLDWESVANRVARNPAAMQLAAAVLRLAGVRRMKLWLDCDADPAEAARDLGSMLGRYAPQSLLRVLSLLETAGELQRDLLDELAVSDDDLGVGVDLAIGLRLAEERHGVLRAIPFLGVIRAIPPPEHSGAETLVKEVVGRLLSPVNDRSSLRPVQARAVLDAHRLQLAVNDLDGALTTARLHLGGLIMHARRLSLEAERPEDFDQARRAYASILQLMSSERPPGQSRARAYVVHYHGFNGYRARTLGLDRVASDYRESTEGWQENALFHARRIALEVERGDVQNARALLGAAYQRVPEHPRRDAVLRVRPAGWAVRAGAPEFALELLEHGPCPDELLDVDPEAHHVLLGLHRLWGGKGIEIDRLAIDDHRLLVFRGPVRMRVRAVSTGWAAEIDYPPARAHGPGPWSAVQALGAAIADECTRLVTQPTGRLPRHDVGTKGLYLGAIDLSLSEIGLPHQGLRWIVGKFDNGSFVCTTEDLGPLAIAAGISADPRAEGLFFGRVTVDRAGVPNGPVDRIVPAGAGRTMTELMTALREIASEDEDAA